MLATDGSRSGADHRAEAGRVLIEPTAGVDPAGSRDILNLIVDLKQRGIPSSCLRILAHPRQEICDRSDSRAWRAGSGRPPRGIIAIEHRSELVLEMRPNRWCGKSKSSLPISMQN